MFLDFDGTLSRLVADPDRARLLPGLKNILKKLARHPHIRIMIISGRSLADVRKRFGINNLIYAGNHGFEIYFKKRYLLRKGKKYRAIVSRASSLLKKQLRDIPGVIVEPKGLSVAVHFRNTPYSYLAVIKKTVEVISKSTGIKNKLALTTGKKIFELRPHKNWNKGFAVRWVWQKMAPKACPIFIGDDVTDEDAFEALKKDGMTIRVGKKQKSAALYYIKQTEDVVKTLSQIAQLFFNQISKN
ncbi:MAG: trehalose-phosphatase [Deltaproteobacteria bacterium]|nr:trehalose-phosphatase [Deltaproteobacteria bacterium]